MNPEINLTKNITLNSPIILGASDYLLDMTAFKKIADSTKLLGAFVTKSFTLNPRAGNNDPIIAIMDNNIMVSSGMRNPGAKVMLEHIRQYNTQYVTPHLIASIAIDPNTTNSRPEDELSEMAIMLHSVGVKIIELNLSCPNLNSNQLVADKQGMIEKIITTIKDKLLQQNIDDVYLIAKLGGDEHTLTISAQVAEKSGVDAITIIPVLRAIGFDTGLLSNHSIVRDKPVLGNIHGTIYGAGIGPITRYLAFKLKEIITIPIIASGGCMGGIHSSILDKTDGLIQTILSGAIATEVVSPFYPFDSHKLNEIDQIVDHLKSINFEGNK